MIQSEDSEGTESTASSARDSASDLEVTAPCELGPPLEERPLGRLQYLSGARKKTDLILCTESLESWLITSADRSIARRAESVAPGHDREGRHVGLEKQCLLIEVRRIGQNV
jgi:hypothetical protein